MIIDLSQYNTISNLQKAFNNVDEVIVRVGYRGYGSGALVEDNKFSYYMKAIQDMKIPYGIYFMSQAINESEAIQESVYCIGKVMYNAIKPSHIWIDSEWSNPKKNGRADSLSKTARTKVCKAFIDKCIASGFDSGLYCSDSWLNEHLNYSTIQNYKLWIARYSSKEPNHKWYMWQYTSKGTVGGINGYVDMSKLNDKISEVKDDIPSLKGYTGYSITSGLKKFRYDYSFAYRKEIAERLGISNYKGTMLQNLKLVSMLKSR